MILVHGYPDTKEVWSQVAARLADRFHVVLYDVRGHGGSTAPRPLRGGFTLEKLTDDFLAVADAVSPDRPVHLVGHDWGSVQSWEFVDRRAYRGPDRVLHVDVRAVPRPPRPLDQGAPEAAHPARGRPTPRPGRQSWYVYALHTPVLPELAWRGPLGRRWPKLLARLEKVSGGRLSDRLAAHGRGPRRLALPGQRPVPAAPAAPGRARARARAADHADRGRLPLRAALRRAGAVGAPAGAPHARPPSTGSRAPGPTSWPPGSGSS